MNHKVLLADDSLTIQKVIKITLANQPYDITEASSEEELFKQLQAVQPKLVFLDFNLSEKYTGYELTTKIKSMLPSAKVLLLLGTFDSVDDASMEKCGASDKIVKPFDSNKFIAICKQLIDTFVDADIAYPEAKKESPVLDTSSPEDQWTVSHTTAQKFPEPVSVKEKTLPFVENPLLKEVSDWGMSVPEVIDDHSGHSKVIDLPPVITSKETKLNEPKYPDNNDLDYPTIEELSAVAPAPAPEVKKEEPKPVSKLISIDSFKDAPVEFELEGSNVADETDIKSLEAQIRDEVADNLWQADEFEELKKEVSLKMEEVKSNFQPSLNDFDESLFKPVDDAQSVNWNDVSSFETSAASSVNMDDIRKEMEEMVKKYVKEYMDNMFQKQAEKIAWEVIPDLAENLIRQELSKISNKILNDQA